MSKEKRQLGIEVAPGILLAPRMGTDEDDAIHYQPPTAENFALKLKAIREMCLELERDSKMVSGSWVSGGIMCIIKYGEGFSQEQLKDLRRWDERRGDGVDQAETQSFWAQFRERFWPKG